MRPAPESIWLDAQGAQNREHFDRGIPRYVSDHLKAVVAVADESIGGIGLNGDLPLTGNLDWVLGTGLLRWGGVHRPVTPPSVYHVMSPFELSRPLEDIWPQWARGPGVSTVVTLYDLIPLVFADHYLQDRRLRASYLARAELIRRADHVMAISATTAEDAIRYLSISPERVTVIDAGVSNHFADAHSTRDEAVRVVERECPRVRPGFMLYVAGIEFRKNIDRLIQAHGRTCHRFRDRHQLVITCRMRPEDERRVHDLAAAAGLREGDLVLTNYVNDSTLAALYRACELFVFASFYEGSGLPILEAMACEAPVAASRSATSPEILGDMRATFDPFDIDDMAAVLESTLSDASLMADLRERSKDRVRGYSWEHVANRTLEGYEKLQSTVRARPRRRRARIALYTPWPPERSGIADYNRRLLAELVTAIEVDVVVVGGAAYDNPPRGATLLPADGMGTRSALRAHDRVVYAMGNSAFHGYVLEALQQRPGPVVCHDVRFTGFYGWYAGQERPEDPVGRLAERMAAQYGGRLGRPFLDAAPTPFEQQALGIYLTQEVQHLAELLLVHSDYAANVLRLDRGPAATVDTPVEVLPLAFPDVSARRVRREPGVAPLILSLGIVSSVKSPDVLIEAVTHLLSERPKTRLVFAGGASDAELTAWRALAQKAGVEGAVEFLGHVSGDVWDGLLDDADIVVQLRRVSSGEASAAVTHAMAAGLPTIVTDQGWAAELPHEAVVKVPPELTGTAMAEVLSTLLDDLSRRQQLSDAAIVHAEATSFAAVAAQYVEVLDLG